MFASFALIITKAKRSPLPPSATNGNSKSIPDGSSGDLLLDSQVKKNWITFWITKRNIVFFRWTLDFIRRERSKLRGPYMLDGQPWPHACSRRSQSIPFLSSWDTPLFSKWLEDGAFETMFSISPWGIFKGWTNVGRQRRDSNFYRSKSVIFSHMYEF